MSDISVLFWGLIVIAIIVLICDPRMWGLLLVLFIICSLLVWTLNNLFLIFITGGMIFAIKCTNNNQDPLLVIKQKFLRKKKG